MKIYKIPIGTELYIYMMPAPNAQNNLYREVQFLKNKNVGTLVSLLSNPEIKQLNLKEEGSICKDFGIDFYAFPITDFGTPKDVKAFIEFGLKRNKELSKAKHLAIHCHAGIGRSSLFAALLLVLNGWNKENVFSYISQYRKVKVPDTKAQIDWFLSICADLEKLK